jgi:hypothetical protein
MNDQRPSADDVADLVLRYDGPHDPDQVIAATATISALIRRVNNATRRGPALRYPPQVDRAVGTLRYALFGLQQTFDQIAGRLDEFTADRRVRHDAGGDAWDASAQAADHLRSAAAALITVTAPLDQAIALTNHLGYDTSTDRPRRRTFPPPDDGATVHEGQSPSPDAEPLRSTSTSFDPDHDHSNAPPTVPPDVEGWPVGTRGRPFLALAGEQPASASPSADLPASALRAPRRSRT